MFCSPKEKSILKDKRLVQLKKPDVFYGISPPPESFIKLLTMKTYIQSAIVCVVFAFIAQSSFAQAKDAVVSGTVVVDEDSTPLPGVNITIAGTTIGMVTDADGKFSFPMGLKPGDKLNFSFVGFVSQNYLVTAEANQNIAIRLKNDNVLIEEVASNDHYSVKTRRGILGVLKGKN
jgi:hypothetical protein